MTTQQIDHTEIAAYESAITARDETIQALIDRLENLEFVLADKLNAATMLTGMNVQNGAFEIGLEGGAASLLAEALAKQYKDSTATNYMEVSFTSSEVMPSEKFIVTVQRVAGQTPHQLRVQAESERDALKADAERYRFLRNTHSWETAIWEALDMAEGESYQMALDYAVDAAMKAAP